MEATAFEKSLGNSLDERRAALKDTSRFDYDEKSGLYISKDGKHRVTWDGDEVVDAPDDDNFDDVAKRRYIERYGYYEGIRRFNERKGGK